MKKKTAFRKPFTSDLGGGTAYKKRAEKEENEIDWSASDPKGRRKVDGD